MVLSARPGSARRQYLHGLICNWEHFLALQNHLNPPFTTVDCVTGTESKEIILLM